MFGWVCAFWRVCDGFCECAVSTLRYLCVLFDGFEICHLFRFRSCVVASVFFSVVRCCCHIHLQVGEFNCLHVLGMSLTCMRKASCSFIFACAVVGSFGMLLVSSSEFWLL